MLVGRLRRGSRRRRGAADDRRSLARASSERDPVENKDQELVVDRLAPGSGSAPGRRLIRSSRCSRPAHGHGRARAAHRVPQPHQHDARARSGAAQGDRAAARARQRPRAGHPPAPDREPAARRGRQPRRTAARDVGSEPARRFAGVRVCRSSSCSIRRPTSACLPRRSGSACSARWSPASDPPGG